MENLILGIIIGLVIAVLVVVSSRRYNLGEKAIRQADITFSQKAKIIETKSDTDKLEEILNYEKNNK